MEQCDECSRTFRLRFALRQHIRIIHRRKNYELEDHHRFNCPFCSFATFSDKAFTAHSFLAHSDKSSLKYKCRICYVEFKTKIQAIRHRKTKAHKRKFRMKSEVCEKINCGFCDENFNEAQEHEDHMWSKHLQQTSQCGFCGLRFAFPQELSAHVRTNCFLDANKESLTFKSGRKIIFSIHCDEESDDKSEKKGRKGCDFTCDNTTMLYYHKMLKHSLVPQTSYSHNYPLNNFQTGNKKLQPPRLPCIVCGKSVARGKLWQHLCIHGETSDVIKRKCNNCYKTFPTVLHLQAHKRRTAHSSANENVKTSPMIQISSYNNECTKRLHRSVKNGKLRDLLKCSFPNCDYRTMKSSHLKSHQLVHDKNINDRIVCNICDRFSCKRKSELNRHVKFFHPNQSDIPNKKSLLGTQKSVSKYRCDNCNYFTSFKQHYVRHLLVHKSGNKLIYKCKFCTFTCATVENLRKHILKTTSHPGISIYRCSQTNCHFSTNEANSYKNHIISQHRSLFGSLQDIRCYIKDYFLLKGSNANC